MKATFKDFLGAKDVKWWDGLVRTFTRRTSTGGTLTMNKIGAVCDVLEAYGDGTDYSSTALLNALSAITTANVTLLFQPGTWNITENVTIPATIAVCLPQGAKFSITTGKTLTINGMILAGSYTIFDGTGTVAGSPVLMFRDPAWFSGTVTDSMTPTWKTPRTSTIQTDTISETTAAAGVTIDGVLLKDNNVTASQIISTIATGTAPMVVTSTTRVSNLTAGAIGDGTNIIRYKILDIGDWNMDTTGSVAVNHGLTFSKIRPGISALIRDDTNAVLSPVTPGSITTPVEVDCYIYQIITTQVLIYRTVGGSFDNTSYDSTSYNRGWIIIPYVD